MHALLFMAAVSAGSRCTPARPITARCGAYRASPSCAAAGATAALVALPLVGATAAVAVLLAAERAGLGARDPTDWASTAWRWSGADGEVLLHDGDLRVVAHAGGRFRTLHLGASIQSVAVVGPDGVVAATAPAFPYIKLLAALAAALALPPPSTTVPARAPFRALFLGGGGCSLPSLLASALPADASLQVVEIDVRVADAARRYFGAARDGIEIRLADASDFRACVGGGGSSSASRADVASYDLIVVVLFGADNAQCGFATGAAWLAQARCALREGGVLLGNFHSGTEIAREVLRAGELGYRGAFDGASRSWRVCEQANVCVATATGDAARLLAGDDRALADRAAAVARAAGWQFDARAAILNAAPPLRALAKD